MILFPAVDILNARAVRLLYGDFNQVTDYGTPLEMATKWVEQGAEFLHLVDLDGAKSGSAKNLEVVKEIVKKLKVPVQLGGGVRTMEDIELRLNEVGVSRVILGTACYSTPDIIKQAIGKFGAERIVCGIDAKDGKVAIKGWVESVDMTPIELGNKMAGMGLKYVVYTDISRDGALTGVNVGACKEMTDKTGLKCIASGGVSTLDDISELAKIDMYGAILGRAIFTNKFTVGQALDIANKEKK